MYFKSNKFLHEYYIKKKSVFFFFFLNGTIKVFLCPNSRNWTYLMGPWPKYIPDDRFLAIVFGTHVSLRLSLNLHSHTDFRCSTCSRVALDHGYKLSILLSRFIYNLAIVTCNGYNFGNITKLTFPPPHSVYRRRFELFR